MLQLRILFYKLANFVAAYLRHEHVCQDHVRVKLRQPVDCFSTIAGTQHFHAFIREG